MVHETIQGAFRQTNLTNESAEYVGKREELRLAEIELMRHRERVAELRRHLPPGPALEDYKLIEGPVDLDSGDAPTRTVRLSELFTAAGSNRRHIPPNEPDQRIGRVPGQARRAPPGRNRIDAPAGARGRTASPSSARSSRRGLQIYRRSG